MSAVREAETPGASTSRHTLDEPSTEDHQELLTEHFGYHPRAFIDALVYAANEHLYSIIAQFEDFVKGQLRKSNKQTKAAADAEAEKGVYAVLTLLENALDHAFDHLELYCLKVVFGIRPSQAKHMTLTHHRGLDLRTSAERAKDGLAGPLSAKEESLELQEKEKQLESRLSKAKMLRHALRVANASANRNLIRAQQLNDDISVIITKADGNAQLPALLPDSARKLSDDTLSLLRAMGQLIDTDSLGSSLLAPNNSNANESDVTQVAQESGASEEEREAWKGREGYINWEVNRFLRHKLSRRMSDADNQSMMLMATPNKRRKSTAAADSVGGDAEEWKQLAEQLTDDGEV